jgi:hypothetical protein
MGLPPTARTDHPGVLARAARAVCVGAISAIALSAEATVDDEILATLQEIRDEQAIIKTDEQNQLLLVAFGCGVCCALLSVVAVRS